MPEICSSPGHWRLIRDIPRFFRTAMSRLEILPDDMTLGQFLKVEGYSDYFLDRHLLPMAGAIWSAAAGDMRDYPARAFLRFFENHGLLQLTNRPLWRTVKGGSREYVSKAHAGQRAFESASGLLSKASRAKRLGVTIHSAHGDTGRPSMTW
jgi:uncharacterized protein